MFCRDCRKSFTVKYDQVKKYSKILLDHLDGISYRDLVSRYNIHRTRLCRIVNSLTNSLKRCIEVTQELKPEYSGNLIVDGKYVPVKVEAPDTSGKIPKSKKRRKLKRGLVYIPGVDYHTHDLPHMLSDFSENFWIFNQFFKNLKSINYPLKSLTCDDTKAQIISSCLVYYPEAKIQLCLAHYSREINRKLKIQAIKRRIKSLEKKLEALDDDIKVPTRFYAIERGVRLNNQIANLEYWHQTMIDFQGIMQSIIFAKSIKQRDERLDYLNSVFFKYWIKESLLTRAQRLRISKVYHSLLKDSKFLFIHLEHPELRIPTTTNLLEGINSQIEDRLTHIRGFESRKTADNYLNALILQRRFKKLTSCRNYFRHLNGKTPIEHTGVDISKIKSWVRFCLKKQP